MPESLLLPDGSRLPLPDGVRAEDVSDGYHSYVELYSHRIALFIALCRMIKKRELAALQIHSEVWRSKLHSDGTAIEGWFVLGIRKTPGWQITYHLPLARWEQTNFADTLERAPEWDGHTAADVLERLKKL